MEKRWEFSDCYVKCVRPGGATGDHAGTLALRKDGKKCVLVIHAQGEELARYRVGQSVRNMELDTGGHHCIVLLSDFSRLTITSADAPAVLKSLLLLSEGVHASLPEWVAIDSQHLPRSPKAKFLLTGNNVASKENDAAQYSHTMKHPPTSRGSPGKGKIPLREDRHTLTHTSRWLTSFSLFGSPTAASRRKRLQTPSRAKPSIPQVRLDSLMSPSRRTRPPINASVSPRKQSPSTSPSKVSQSAVGHKASSTSGSEGQERSSKGSEQGLVNLGNTCFMNAVLQALMSLPCFTGDLLLHDLLDQPLLANDCFYVALARLFDRKTTLQAITAKDLQNVKDAIARNARQFSGNLQQDAHEFLCQIVDQLEHDLLPVMNADESVSQKIPTARNFYSEVTHIITCSSCGHSSQAAELYHDLSLGIPSGGKHDLQSIVEAFFEPEDVERNCHCGHHVSRITHRFSVLPRVLVLQLKRFRASLAGDIEKQHLPVVAPVQLDIGKIVSSDTLYPLPYNVLKRARVDSPSPRKISASMKKQFAVKEEERATKCTKALSPACVSSEEVKRSTVVDLTASTDSSWEGLELVSADEGLRLGLMSSAEELELALERSKADDRRKVSASLQEDLDLEEALRISRYEAEEKARHDHEADRAAALGAVVSRQEDEPMAVNFFPLPTDRCMPIGSSAGSTSYRLVSKINHLGSSRDSGHYVTDSFNFASESWSRFDDSHVKEVSATDVLEGEAESEGYLFFYIHEKILFADS